MRDLIAILEASARDLRDAAAARADEAFSSLDEIKSWAAALGVKLDASEHLHATHRYNSYINLDWIERIGDTAPGTGRIVLKALCAYADRIGAMIDLQAADEERLPPYYDAFGFEEYEDPEKDDDVRPSGPDMRRFPAGFKQKRRPKAPAAQPPAARPSEPVGVIVWFNEYGYLHYAVVDPHALVADQKAVLAWARAKVRTDRYATRLLGYVIDTPSWTVEKAKAQPVQPLDGLKFQRQQPAWKGYRNHTTMHDEYERWANLTKLGQMVFDTDSRRKNVEPPTFG